MMWVVKTSTDLGAWEVWGLFCDGFFKFILYFILFICLPLDQLKTSAGSMEVTTCLWIG